MGTPWRSKSFHDAYYGKMGDNTLPDQVAGMKELARRYPWIDLDRAGIYGHSGGGFAAAGAMFRYPDFFKVGVSQAGNHDNRVYEDDWGERYQGLLVGLPNGSDNYAAEANQAFAGNLKGKLLLAHGTLDDNVPPNSTLLVSTPSHRTRIRSDPVPNDPDRHELTWFGVWDYFVKHVLGADRPRVPVSETIAVIIVTMCVNAGLSWPAGDSKPCSRADTIRAQHPESACGTRVLRRT